MLTIQEITNLDNGLYFDKTKLLGEGLGGSVYLINSEYVVKKLSLINKSFKLELETTVLLSNNNISPKVIYHSSNKNNFNYYVMEKLDYTLYHMFKHKLFTPQHIYKLNAILERLNKTFYRHDDLHLNNIMWSTSHNDFRIIDWGVFRKIKNKKYKQSPTLIKRIKKWMTKSVITHNFCGFKVNFSCFTKV